VDLQMSHEVSFDFEAEGRHFLAPSVINGKPTAPKRVIDAIMSGKMRPLAQASTPQAIKAIAEQRSTSHGAPAQSGLDQLFDIIKQLNGTAKPRPDLVASGSPYTFAGRVATKPEDPRALLARPPTESPDAEGMSVSLPKMLAGVAPGAAASIPRVAKTMKAGPQTLEEYIQKLAQEQRGVNINSHLAAIRNPKTGEVMTGGTGMRAHPWDVAPGTFTERGFTPPDLPQQGFMPDLLATNLQQPKAVALVAKSLKAGKTIAEAQRDLFDAIAGGLIK
jgi:hypothetical protein